MFVEIFSKIVKQERKVLARQALKFLSDDVLKPCRWTL